MQQRIAGIRQGLLLVAIAWLAPIGSTLFAPVLPHMIDHFSAVPHAALLAPVALVTPALLVALLAPVAGLLADRFGRKRLLMAALALYAVAGVLPYWIDNLYVIILTRMVVGVAEAGVMTVSTALICDYFTGDRRAHWLSVQFGSASLVAIFCFALAGFLGSFDWPAPFLVYGGTALFIPLVLAVLFEPARAAEPEQRAVVETVRLLSARVVGCLALTLICGALFYVTPVHISLVLNERGISDPQMLGLASAIGAMGAIAGAALFRVLSRRAIGALLTGAMALQAAGYCLLYTQPSLSGTVIGMFVNNIGCGISLPLVLALTMSKLPDAYRGRASGIWTSMFFIGQFSCPLMIGVASAAAGGMVATMGLLASITGVAALLLLATSIFGRSLRQPVTTGAAPIPMH